MDNAARLVEGATVESFEFQARSSEGVGETSIPRSNTLNARNGLEVEAIVARCTIERLGGEDSLGQSIDIREYAELSDGSLLLLKADRGASIGGGNAGEPAGRAELTESALIALLPDEGDHLDEGEKLPWHLLAEQARGKGLIVTADQLRTLPFRLEFSEGT